MFAGNFKLHMEELCCKYRKPAGLQSDLESFAKMDVSKVRNLRFQHVGGLAVPEYTINLELFIVNCSISIHCKKNHQQLSVSISADGSHRQNITITFTRILN
jgi:hypothetical protein